MRFLIKRLFRPGFIRALSCGGGGGQGRLSYRSEIRAASPLFAFACAPSKKEGGFVTRNRALPRRAKERGLEGRRIARFAPGLRRGFLLRFHLSMFV